MMEFLYQHNLVGLAIGLVTFLVIGLFHPLVIKGEYYFGVRVWIVFLVMGFVGIGLALALRDIMFSTIAGVFGFSCFWSIREVFEQRERVSKGWFPANPKRKNKGK